VTFIFFMMALKIKGILTKLIDSLNLAIFTKLTPPLHPYIASQIRVGAFPSLSLTSNGSPFLRFLRTMDKIRCLCHTLPPRFPTPRLGTSSRRRARHAVRCRARGGGVQGEERRRVLDILPLGVGVLCSPCPSSRSRHSIGYPVTNSPNSLLLGLY
jgi:hypothetical protein